MGMRLVVRGYSGGNLMHRVIRDKPDSYEVGVAVILVYSTRMRYQVDSLNTGMSSYDVDNS